MHIVLSFDYTFDVRHQKERDLELAARIGQTLLEKNNKLLAENEELEDQLLEANEKVRNMCTVYRHDILHHAHDHFPGNRRSGLKF